MCWECVVHVLVWKTCGAVRIHDVHGYLLCALVGSTCIAVLSVHVHHISLIMFMFAMTVAILPSNKHPRRKHVQTCNMSLAVPLSQVIAVRHSTTCNEIRAPHCYMSTTHGTICSENYDEGPRYPD